MKYLICWAGLLAVLVSGGRGADYRLEAVSTARPMTTLAGGAYQMTARVAPPDALRAAGAGYTMEAVAADVFVARSAELPTLTIRLAGDGSGTVSWTDAEGRFDLETAPELPPAGTWQRFATLVRTGDAVTATFGPGAAGSTRFFRLIAR